MFVLIVFVNVLAVLPFSSHSSFRPSRFVFNRTYPHPVCLSILAIQVVFGYLLPAIYFFKQVLCHDADAVNSRRHSEGIMAWVYVRDAECARAGRNVVLKVFSVPLQRGGSF